VTRSVAETAARLGADGRAYPAPARPLTSHMDDVLEAILAPLRTAARASAGRRELRPPGHPAGLVVARRWDTDEARAIMAGAAAHAMMPLTAVPTAGIGLMLIGLAHAVGWPVVAGGSARITDAMAAALVASGGRIETGRWVRSLAELPSAGRSSSTLAARAGSAGRRHRCPAGTGPRCAGSATAPASARLTSPCPVRCRGPAAVPPAGSLHLGGTFGQVAAGRGRSQPCRRGAVAEPAQRGPGTGGAACRRPAEPARAARRRGGWPGGRELGERAHPAAGLDAAAAGDQGRGHRVGDPGAPPATTGQPTAWARPISIGRSPRSHAVSGIIACAAAPAMIARASSVSHRLATTEAGRMARRP